MGFASPGSVDGRRDADDESRMCGAHGWQALVDRTSRSYRPAGPFARHFASGKLRHDPVFRHLLEHGLVGPHERVLDLGCGQGLLAVLVDAARGEASSGRWPVGWAAAPIGARVIGIDLDPRDIARARKASGGDAEFLCGDMRDVAFPNVETVVILDALHYIEAADQDAVLDRARAALTGGGRLVLRVGDASSRRIRASRWLDALVCRLRGNRCRAGPGRTAERWRAELRRLGFTVESRPMSRGTPFANVLFVATLTRGAVLA